MRGSRYVAADELRRHQEARKKVDEPWKSAPDAPAPAPAAASLFTEPAQHQPSAQDAPGNAPQFTPAESLFGEPPQDDPFSGVGSAPSEPPAHTLDNSGPADSAGLFAPSAAPDAFALSDSPAVPQPEPAAEPAGEPAPSGLFSSAAELWGTQSNDDWLGQTHDPLAVPARAAQPAQAAAHENYAPAGDLFGTDGASTDAEPRQVDGAGLFDATGPGPFDSAAEPGPFDALKAGKIDTAGPFDTPKAGPVDSAGLFDATEPGPFDSAAAPGLFDTSEHVARASQSVPLDAPGERELFDSAETGPFDQVPLDNVPLDSTPDAQGTRNAAQGNDAAALFGDAHGSDNPPFEQPSGGPVEYGSLDGEPFSLSYAAETGGASDTFYDGAHGEDARDAQVSRGEYTGERAPESFVGEYTEGYVPEGYADGYAPCAHEGTYDGYAPEGYEGEYTEYHPAYAHEYRASDAAEDPYGDAYGYSENGEDDGPPAELFGADPYSSDQAGTTHVPEAGEHYKPLEEYVRHPFEENLHVPEDAHHDLHQETLGLDVHGHMLTPIREVPALAEEADAEDDGDVDKVDASADSVVDHHVALQDDLANAHARIAALEREVSERDELAAENERLRMQLAQTGAPRSTDVQLAEALAKLSVARADQDRSEKEAQERDAALAEARERIQRLEADLRSATERTGSAEKRSVDARQREGHRRSATATLMQTPRLATQENQRAFPLPVRVPSDAQVPAPQQHRRNESLSMLRARIGDQAEHAPPTSRLGANKPVLQRRPADQFSTEALMFCSSCKGDLIIV